ncbi:MAG: AIR carboxylase family protein [Nanoarchaeota archaeon]
MGERLLVQMRASDRDPKLVGGVTIESQPFKEYFSSRGIRTLEPDLVVSCHGNTDLTLQYARQIQALADAGNKVVVLAHGGLFFALPSLIAANAPTVPVISIPMGGDEYGEAAAFLGAYVPPGTAAIATTGINQYVTAARAATAILNNQFEGAYLRVHKETEDSFGTLWGKLESLGVPFLGDPQRGLEHGLITSIPPLDMHAENFGRMEEVGDLVVYGTVPNPKYASNVNLHMTSVKDLSKSVWAGRPDATAFFVAKCLAAYYPNIAANLKKAAENKAGSYEVRNLTLDEFVKRQS